MPSMEYRRLRRTTYKRRQRAILAALAGLAVLGAAAAATMLWTTRSPHKATGDPSGARATALAFQSQSPGSSSPTQAAAPSVDATHSANAAPRTARSTSATATKAAERADRAMSKAAVPFPDAPALRGSTKSISQLKPRHKYIALTLDDGYSFQPAMLAYLKAHNVRCTTFVVGNWASENKKALRQMRDAGFEIANHSWSHPFLTHLSASGIERELTRTQKVISSVTGNQAPYLRPPFGDTDTHVKATAAGLGYRVVMWNRSFGDSGRGATPSKLYKNVVKANGGVKPGDIILGHWSSKPTYEALQRIVPELQAQGYEFVTVSELLADSKE